jgi:tRNA-splicing ligase RtcB (3'-phosphate/5'-hydroxy nucleic acid ligase)
VKIWTRGVPVEEAAKKQLHSGSAGVCGRIGSYFVELTKNAMEQWHISLPDPDLAYLPEAPPLLGVYWKALSWTKDYAMTNRTPMMEAVKSARAHRFGLSAAKESCD